jgi:hypothetical protein
MVCSTSVHIFKNSSGREAFVSGVQTKLHDPVFSNLGILVVLVSQMVGKGL